MNLKKTKLANFDCLRIIAILGIVLDHYFGGPIGRFLGETFNCVFFGLSALLLGMKWEQKGRPKYKFFQFLFPRYIRLSVSLYPFLIIAFVFFYVFDIPFSLKDLLMSFAFLSWLVNSSRKCNSL